jgi:hypothetical protein
MRIAFQKICIENKKNSSKKGSRYIFGSVSLNKKTRTDVFNNYTQWVRLYEFVLKYYNLFLFTSEKKRCKAD